MEVRLSGVNRMLAPDRPHPPQSREEWITGVTIGLTLAADSSNSIAKEPAKRREASTADLGTIMKTKARASTNEFLNKFLMNFVSR